MKSLGTDAKKILVVEDESSIQRIFSETLAFEGFEVDVAANGVQAESWLHDRDYDLLIIDIKTPLMNGIELYGRMVEKHAALTGRVIFTSGDVVGLDTASFLKETGRPFLAKPFHPDEVVTIVKETMRRSKDD